MICIYIILLLSNLSISLTAWCAQHFLVESLAVYAALSLILPHRAALVVPGQGVEPRFLGPKPSVLPLDDPGILLSNNTPTLILRNRYKKHTTNDHIIIVWYDTMFTKS